MESSLLVKAIIGLVAGIISLWGAYLALQSAKDKAIQRERDRADKLIKDKELHFETELREERTRTKEEKDLLIQHYERTIKTIKRLAGLPENGPFDDQVKEETHKTGKLDKEELKKEGVAEFKDSQCFQDAMLSFADERVSVIEKAKSYLAKDYIFKDKSNLIIMRDSLKAEKSDVDFKDCEVGVAFKMLEDSKATNELKNFADGEVEVSTWDKLIKGEV